MKRTAITVALATVALAGCGSSNDAKSHQAAINYCAYGGTYNGKTSQSTGTRSSCECAVNNAEAQGYTDQKLVAEIAAKTILSDKKLFTIALACAGR